MAATKSFDSSYTDSIIISSSFKQIITSSIDLDFMDNVAAYEFISLLHNSNLG